MAKSSKPAKYDLKAADRKRDLAVKIGLTAVVVIFAVALVGYILITGDKRQPGEAISVRVASPEVIKQDDSDEPKVVLSVFEDFQCPHCAEFEAAFGPTLNKLIDSGAIAVDYYAVAFMDSPTNQDSSSRSANAAYCVGDADTTPAKDGFRRFHTALFTNQSPTGNPDSALIETARQAGVVDGVSECVESGKFDKAIAGLAAATGVTATPALRFNGEDYQYSTPADLVAKVEEMTGPIPALDAIKTPTPAPAPAPAS